MAKWKRRLAQVEMEAIQQKNAKPKPPEIPVVIPQKVIPAPRPFADEEQMVTNFAWTLFDKPWGKPRFITSEFKNDCLLIHFMEFGTEPEIDFEFLVKFSKFFQTKNINIPGINNDYEGCSSCGNGAYWSFSLVIKDMKANVGSWAATR